VDDQRFEALARLIGSGASRRRVLKVLAASLPSAAAFKVGRTAARPMRQPRRLFDP